MKIYLTQFPQNEKFYCVDLLDFVNASNCLRDLDISKSSKFNVNCFLGDVLGAMTRRFTSQYSQLKNLVLHVLGLGAPPSATQRAGLVRDDFGLHKMIVVVTASGKVVTLFLIYGNKLSCNLLFIAFRY